MMKNIFEKCTPNFIQAWVKKNTDLEMFMISGS